MLCNLLTTQRRYIIMVINGLISKVDGVPVFKNVVLTQFSKFKNCVKKKKEFPDDQLDKMVKSIRIGIEMLKEEDKEVYVPLLLEIIECTNLYHQDMSDDDRDRCINSINALLSMDVFKSDNKKSKANTKEVMVEMGIKPDPIISKKRAVELIKEIDPSPQEIRSILTSYYQAQDRRIGIQNQIRAIIKSPDYDVRSRTNVSIMEIALLTAQNDEETYANILNSYADSNTICQWLMQIKGIGKILATTMVAYFNIEVASSASSFYEYGGLNDNNRKWLKSTTAYEIVRSVIGDSNNVTTDHLLEIASIIKWKPSSFVSAVTDEKGKILSVGEIVKKVSAPPYNATLKKQLWKVGESFVKVSNKPDSLYGRLYKEKLAKEIALNSELAFKDQAKEILATKNWSDKSSDTYQSYLAGKLPLSHLIARAKRWTVKIFVSHLFEEMYRDKYHAVPPKFYTLEFKNHVHYIEPEIPFTWYGEDDKKIRIDNLNSDGKEVRL